MVTANVTLSLPKVFEAVRVTLKVLPEEPAPSDLLRFLARSAERSTPTRVRYVANIGRVPARVQPSLERSPRPFR